MNGKLGLNRDELLGGEVNIQGIPQKKIDTQKDLYGTVYLTPLKKKERKKEGTSPTPKFQFPPHCYFSSSHGSP